jgi:hypothetical protein
LATVYDGESVGASSSVIEQVKVDVELDLPGLQCCLADSPPFEGAENIEGGTVEALPVGQLLVKHLRLQVQLARTACELNASVGTLMVHDCDPTSPFPLMLTPMARADTAVDEGDSNGAWLQQQEAQPLLSVQLRLLPHATATLTDSLAVEASRGVEIRLSFNFARDLAQRMDAIATVFTNGGHGQGDARAAQASPAEASPKAVHVRSLAMPHLNLALKFDFNDDSSGSIGIGFGAAGESEIGRPRGSSSAGVGAIHAFAAVGDDTTIDLGDMDDGAMEAAVEEGGEDMGSQEDGPSVSMKRSMSATELAKAVEQQSSRSLAHAKGVLERAESMQNQAAARARARHAAGAGVSVGLGWFEDSLVKSMCAVLSQSSFLATAALQGGLSLSSKAVTFADEEGHMQQLHLDLATRMRSTLALQPLSDMGDDGGDDGTGSGGAHRTSAALSSMANAAARSGADAVGDLMQLTSKEVTSRLHLRCLAPLPSSHCLSDIPHFPTLLPLTVYRLRSRLGKPSVPVRSRVHVR